MKISESDLLVGHEYKILVPDNGYLFLRYDGKMFECLDEGRNEKVMVHKDLEYLIRRMNFRFYHRKDEQLELGE